jgi:ribosomal protein L23
LSSGQRQHSSLLQVEDDDDIDVVSKGRSRHGRRQQVGKETNPNYEQKRAWMPIMPMMLVSAKDATTTHPAQGIFRVPPRMTKHEIAEYLRAIYSLPVASVNTMNYDGKRKRLQNIKGTAMHFYKYASYKKAVVTFERKYLTNVGIGMKIPELGTDDSDESDEEQQPQLAQGRSRKKQNTNRMAHTPDTSKTIVKGNRTSKKTVQNSHVQKKLPTNP